MTPTWRRCFIALAPDDQARRHLAGLSLHANARRVASADLHLTLAFLGGLDASQAQALARTLDLLARPLPSLAFSGIELWPGARRPRVAVATFALPDALAQLLDALHPFLMAMQLPIDSRPFRAHVTLARFRQAPNPPMPPEAPPGAFTARFTRLGLFARAPESAPTRYTALSLTDLPAAGS